MGEPGGPVARPNVYSIAAHRGFADALVAGLVPRYSDPEFGLARTTLLLPSSRASRTIAEAFIRQAGETGRAGLLMPRMVVVGDLDLDEALGPLLDGLGINSIPPAVDPLRRQFVLANLIAQEMGEQAPSGATLLRLARETGQTMDRLLVEDVAPGDLLKPAVLDLSGDLSAHWQNSLRLFARVQLRWEAQLAQWGAVDRATRRNRLFDMTAQVWKSSPPQDPIIAAGVTSAAPSLARLLRVVSELPQGAVVLPDLDLGLPKEVWEELGRAGVAPTASDTPFARDDADTHPQYHLKVLLNRMGVAREEVRSWHRSGVSASTPDRSRAISALFLPPQASKSWVDLPTDQRRLSGVRIMQTAQPEEEAQAVALLVRQALETDGKRVAVVTPERTLARRISQHLGRWNIIADDSAGRPLSQTTAGRFFLLLAQVASGEGQIVSLMALLGHPFAQGTLERGDWLRNLRLVERELRGPAMQSCTEAISRIVERLSAGHPGLDAWWREVSGTLAKLIEAEGNAERPLAGLVDELAAAAAGLAGDRIWDREDGRALAAFIDEYRLQAREAQVELAARDVATVLGEAMDEIAVRPPYGGSSRVQILGLLEARMNRADLIICAGLNEGVWPGRGAVDALLAPPVLRALGVPGSDFRIGLSAHDLAGAMGAPEVVLSRAARDDAGPTIPSRFLLRAQALLYDHRADNDLSDRHRETVAVELARALVRAPAAAAYPRPQPRPSPEQRRVSISATALDRLRSDPYQFYASHILRLKELAPIDADPDSAWQGTIAHEILETWHKQALAGATAPIAAVARATLQNNNVHPLQRALWEPRLIAALEWVEQTVAEYGATRKVVAAEVTGSMHRHDIRIHGRADRLDQFSDGSLAIVDYKTGKPPNGAMVANGFSMQLGLLGLIARSGGFADVSGEPEAFEYWSLGKAKGDDHPTGFGYVETPLKIPPKRSGIEPGEFVPLAEYFLEQALADWILGSEPFTARLNPELPGYGAYDQLMRLDEWLPLLDNEEAGT